MENSQSYIKYTDFQKPHLKAMLDGSFEPGSFLFWQILYFLPHETMVGRRLVFLSSKAGGSHPGSLLYLQKITCDGLRGNGSWQLYSNL